MTEICHRHQVSTSQAYRWPDMFLEDDKKALGDSRKKQGRDALVEENQRLKELVGRQALIIEAQKKVYGSLKIRVKRELVGTMMVKQRLNQTQIL